MAALFLTEEPMIVLIHYLKLIIHMFQARMVKSSESAH
jgi:hypothetical protein